MDNAERNQNAAKTMDDANKYDIAVDLYQKALTFYQRAYKFTSSELDHRDINKECQLITDRIKLILSQNKELRHKYNQHEVSESDDDSDDDDESEYKDQPKEAPICMQIISDIHLEFDGVYKKMKKPQNKDNKATILALLGDIGYPKKSVYKQFIAEMSKQYKYILIIAGNHEYYKEEIYNVHSILKEIESQYSNVYFLQKRSIEFPDLSPNIRFVGCTLWVNYPKKIQFAAQLAVNDFHHIQVDENVLEREFGQIDDTQNEEIIKEKKEEPETLHNENNLANEDDVESFVLDELMGNSTQSTVTKKVQNVKTKEWGQSWKKQMILKRALNVNDVNLLHEDHLKWIKKAIACAKKDKKKLIILTHHAPTSYKCIAPIELSEDVSFLMNFSSLESMFKYPVIGWFFGHTHRNCDFCVISEKGKIQKRKWQTRVASNQLGYYDDDKVSFEAKAYSAYKMITFPLSKDDGNESIEYIERKQLIENVKGDKQRRAKLCV